MVKLKEFIGDLWTLLRPYWRSEERRSAWLLLIANIVLTLAMVYMTVLFNDWYNLFYNTLQDKAKQEFFHQIGRFCVLATIYIVIAVYRIYLNQMLQIRWRRWLTDHYLRDWLADRSYYRMRTQGQRHRQPGPADRRRLSVVRGRVPLLRTGLSQRRCHPGLVHRDSLGAIRAS